MLINELAHVAGDLFTAYRPLIALALGVATCAVARHHGAKPRAATLLGVAMCALCALA